MLRSFAQMHFEMHDGKVLRRYSGGIPCDFATNKVHRRLETKVERPGFMTYILRYNDDRSMTIREMEANTALLILAGSETTASLLSGFTYYIMANPLAYRKLVDEIRGSFNSYEDIFPESWSTDLPERSTRGKSAGLPTCSGYYSAGCT